MKISSLRFLWILLAFANIFALFLQWRSGAWLFRPDGSIYAHDYVAQWAAGHRVLWGQANLVYDWHLQVSLNTQLLGADKPAVYYIFYPPHFLFTTIFFVWLKPVPAYLAFLATTAFLYYLALRQINNRDALFATFAGGAAYINLLWVQNGFLTSALLVAALLHLRRRPKLAGFFCGLLTIKPQLGLMIPLALVAGGHWKTILWAVCTFAMLATASEIVFGFGIWAEFLRATVNTAEFLNRGADSLWIKMQSPFALAWPFFGADGALLVQGVSAIIAAVIVVDLWRRDLPYDLKAAGLIACSLLTPPYLYAYDAVSLTAACLFIRHPNRWEILAITVALLLPGMRTYVLSAGVPMASLIVLALVLRRVRLALNVVHPPRRIGAAGLICVKSQAE